LEKSFLEIPLSFNRERSSTSSIAGFGILLYAVTSKGFRIASSTSLEMPLRMNAAKLAQKETKAREAGVQVVKRLIKEIKLGGVVDEYLADQIVIFMALATSGVLPSLATEQSAEGETKERRRSEVLVGDISLHTQTAMKIGEIVLGNIAFSATRVKGLGTLLVCENTKVPGEPQ
jgi:RNA 3'-terminal phosphate cyclase